VVLSAVCAWRREFHLPPPCIHAAHLFSCGTLGVHVGGREAKAIRLIPMPWTEIAAAQAVPAAPTFAPPNFLTFVAHGGVPLPMGMEDMERIDGTEQRRRMSSAGEGGTTS
jgi:hypothetical protein